MFKAQANPEPRQQIQYTNLILKILNQHGDNIQWNYCASLCLNLAYIPHVSRVHVV